MAMEQNIHILNVSMWSNKKRQTNTEKISGLAGFDKQRDKWNEINQMKWSRGLANRDIKRKRDGKS